MTKKELLDIVAAAGYTVLKDTPVRNSDEPPYARHQLIIVKEEGTALNRQMFNYLVKDDGSVFYYGSDPFAVKEPKVKTVFETKLEAYMATLKMPTKVKSTDTSALVKHYAADGDSLKEVCEYCALDKDENIVTEAVASTVASSPI